MALYADYSELQTKILDWIDRPTLTAKVTDWIALAEERLNSELRLRGMLVTESESFTSEIDMSTAFTSPVEGDPVFSIQSLHYVTPEEFDTVWYGSDAGNPKVYTVKGGKVLVAPVPASSVSRDATYFQKVTALSGVNTTNLFTSNAPDTLFYATLLEATPWLKDDERIPIWQGMYDRSLTSRNAWLNPKGGEE